MIRWLRRQARQQENIRLRLGTWWELASTGRVRPVPELWHYDHITRND